ncbi:MAG: NAD-dependent epimerase/dehydratase family protein [Thermoplasmata archaeon]|nr:NAD-dependent epimerase/dehydratase family protein [Thermoplasmata archaeon]
MKLLVTGSSGQLGSYVCELLADKYEIIGMDIKPGVVPGLKSLVGDIRRPGDVREALSGVDAVVHCAAQVSVERSLEDPVSDAETNVIGTINLLQECAARRVRRFVYVSSAAVLGDPKYIPIGEAHPTEPMSNYGASKLAGERFALAYTKSHGVDVVVVRPFNFYSPRADPESPYSGVITKFIQRVKAGEAPIIEGDGLQTRDFIHARDVASCIGLLLEKDDISGEVFNCGSGVATSVLDLAKLVISAGSMDVEPEFTAPRKGDIRKSVADISKAKSLLGFSTKVSLRDGIAEMLG